MNLWIRRVAAFLCLTCAILMSRSDEAVPRCTAGFLVCTAAAVLWLIGRKDVDER